jgi:hypothetical protein
VIKKYLAIGLKEDYDRWIDESICFYYNRLLDKNKLIELCNLKIELCQEENDRENEFELHKMILKNLDQG